MARNPAESTVVVGRPPDFDEFWARTRRMTDEVSPEPELRPRDDLSTEAVRVCELSYTSFQDVRVSAWYTAPRASSAEFPAVVHIPGYISEPSILKSWSQRGYVTLGLAPRGKLRSNSAVNPGYPGLLTHNIVDRLTYGYRGFYMDVMRAIDVLAERPEVDAHRIGVWGSSQGGGLGLIAAALRPEVVRCVAAGAPYLCGIMESARLTHSYPYEEITEYLRVRPQDEPWVTETVAYFDGLNFAPDVRCPALVYLGMEDDVCPPETGFAVHRALTGVKELHTAPRCAHDAGLRWVLPKVRDFLDGYLEPAGADV